MSSESSYTDNTCVEMLNQHDKQAITLLMQRLYPALCLYAESFLNDKQRAEEMAEDAFVNLWQREGNFPNMASVKAYLYKSTRNLCFNKLASLKTRKHIQERWEEDHEMSSDATVLRNIVQSEVMTQIMQAVDALPPVMRQTFKMAFIDGMSNEEIAVAIDKNEQVVRNYKMRALARVREKLADKDLIWLLLLIASQVNKN
jgi:RNA polymerase sigma-70 factor (family 1)